MWNQKRQEFDVYPTQADVIDETLGGAPVYGLGGLDKLLLIMHVLDNATDDRPFERFGRLMHSEGRYWTYNLGYKEEANRGGSCLASYMAAVGHGNYLPLSKYWANNPQFLVPRLALQRPRARLAPLRESRQYHRAGLAQFHRRRPVEGHLVQRTAYFLGPMDLPELGQGGPQEPRRGRLAAYGVLAQRGGLLHPQELDTLRAAGQAGREDGRHLGLGRTGRIEGPRLLRHPPLRRR